VKLLISKTRASVRLFLIIVLSLVVVPLLFLMSLLPSSFNSKSATIERLLARFWIWGISRIMGMKVQSKGDIPKAPFFLVCNHLGYVDTILFARHSPCVFVAAAEIRNWPLIGLLVRASGALFIDRNKPGDVLRINGLVSDALKKGKGVVVFPEGTSTNGSQVLPFRSSLLQPALEHCEVINYACISYQTPVNQAPASETVCWWDKDQKIENHLFRLLSLPSFRARVVYRTHTFKTTDRKVLASQLTDLVRQHLEPMN